VKKPGEGGGINYGNQILRSLGGKALPTVRGRTLGRDGELKSLLQGQDRAEGTAVMCLASGDKRPVSISRSCYYPRMACATARILFENYARAAVELFESADNLANLTGQHERFAEAMKYSKQTHEKCSSARSALEQHRAEHGCRVGVANES
jgi:hypothetical protein